jgi:hypothetical protein
MDISRSCKATIIEPRGRFYVRKLPGIAKMLGIVEKAAMTTSSASFTAATALTASTTHKFFSTVLSY